MRRSAPLWKTYVGRSLTLFPMRRSAFPTGCPRSRLAARSWPGLRLSRTISAICPTADRCFPSSRTNLPVTEPRKALCGSPSMNRSLLRSSSNSSTFGCDNSTSLDKRDGTYRAHDRGGLTEPGRECVRPVLARIVECHGARAGRSLCGDARRD